VNRSIGCYRSITALWLALLGAALYLAVAGRSGSASACLALAAGLILIQSLAFRCNSCGTRPGLWLLAIWTLLFDYQLYIADVVLLQRCPNCQARFERSESGGSPSGRAG